MASKAERLILEVGCGQYPLPVLRSLLLANPKEYEPRLSSILDEYVDWQSGDQFICIDRDSGSIKKAKDELATLVKNNPVIDASKITIKIDDGRRLNFKNKSVDVVIFSDVFSAPYPGATPVSQPYPRSVCISDENKQKMIFEALRVLKDGGVLLICIHLTPCYAVNIMKWIEDELVRTGKLQLIKQCGKFVGRSDNWHLYHAAFQKMPAPAVVSPEIMPWTKRQKEYIREYAAAWDDLMMY